ncbi:MAG: class I SAM-dependent methyltransferase [Edaphobacter sp.]
MERPAGGFGQRVFAWAMAHNQNYERFASAYKQRLFAGLAGTVVELGPGTGTNLRYLDRETVRWIGIDPNPFMLPYLLGEAARLGMTADCRIGTAYELPVESESVDAVICTLVLCCIDDQQRVLREVLRVLKPGGRFVFIEHVAAPEGSRLRRIQDFVAPVWKRLGDGCHPNRETGKELERAGFLTVEYERMTAPLPVVSPQIVGMARKAG